MDSLDPNSPTLTRYLMSTLMNGPDHDGSELVSLLVTIQSIVKNISAAVRRAGIFNVLGAQKGGGCSFSTDPTPNIGKRKG